MRKVVLNFLIHCCLTIGANGQSGPLNQSPLPQAPNTATLGKFGDYQVSLFTGLPSISIPLYTIKTKGFEVPITLSYHASGIKLHEFPGWVGTGWALSAGGNVRRKLVGKPDEGAHGLLSGQPKKSIDIDPQDLNDIEYLNHVNDGNRDFGSDIFSYSLPGADGRFFFNPDDNYKPQLMPFAPLKIEAPASLSTTPFKITDAVGNKYKFGQNYTEFTHSGVVEGGQEFYTSAWMLEEMISATSSDTISFSYQTQYDITPLERSDTWVVDDLIQRYSTLCNGAIAYDINSGTQQSSYSFNQMFSCNNSEIKFPNGKVVFELNEARRMDFGQMNSKALNKIKIFSTATGTDQLIKIIDFHYGYFIDGLDDQSKRLRLDSVRILDQNYTPVETYAFAYNNSVKLPALDVSTMSKDLWGYYNGRNNSSLVPQTQVQYIPFISSPQSLVTIGSSNPIGREPDSVKMQAGILTSIQYPTGGYTEFAYETNRYYDAVTNYKLAGGLRIKTIKSYDHASATPLVKSYKYGINESGNGRANFKPDYYYFSEEIPYEYWRWNCSGEQLVPYLVDKKRRRLYYSSPTFEIEPFDAAPVVYPEVTEYIGEGNNTLGKTVYRFRDSADILYYVTNRSKPIIQSMHFNRGQLINKKIYKRKELNQFQLLNEQKLTYNTIFPSKSVRGGLTLKKSIVRENLDHSDNFTGSDWFYLDYYVFTDDNYLIADTSIVYDENDISHFSKTSTTYSYSNFAHQQPTAVSTTNSKGEIIQSETRYPADYILSGNYTGNAILDTMISKNIQILSIEQWSRKPLEGTVSGGSLNLYKTLSNGLIVPYKSSSLEIIGPVNNYLPGHVSGGVFQADSRYAIARQFLQYDAYANLLEMENRNGIKEVFLWGYNGQYPVAKITNANYSGVSSLITQSILDKPASDNVLREHLQTLRTAIPSKYVNTFSFAPLKGMTSQTDANGRTIFYFYDDAGRLSYVRDHDNNIIKKFCYNYAGQAEDCTSPCPSNSQPTWQNTGNTRCQVNSSCAYTGYQEIEQANVNPCVTSIPNQWVLGSYNPTACGSSGLIQLHIQNNAAATGLMLTLTPLGDLLGGTPFGPPVSFSIPAASGPITCVFTAKNKKYNVEITRVSGPNLLVNYLLGGTTVSGTPASFNNVIFNSLSSDNHTITINSALVEE